MPGYQPQQVPPGFESTAVVRSVGRCILLLIVSGLFNYMAMVQDYKATGDKIDKSYHMLLGVKMLRVLTEGSF